MAHRYANINTAANDHRKMAVVSGFQPLAGSNLNLSISAGFIDGREVLADTSVAVADSNGAADFSGFLVSEDGAGAFVVTDTASDTIATDVLALAAAEALEVPTGDTAIFAGVASNGTAVALLKADSVRGKLPFALIAADETITL